MRAHMTAIISGLGQVTALRNWLAWLFVLIFSIIWQPALAGTTGAWTTAAAPSATANGITLTATGSSSLTPAAGALYTTPYWTNPYGSSVAGGTSLNYVVNPGGTSMTVVFTFSKAVSNPVLHIQRLGGQAGTINSSSWQLSGSNLATTPTMSRLSGNFQFQLNGANTTFFRPVGGAFVSAACTSTAGSTTDDGGMACGSVRVNGTGITSLTFTVSMIGGAGSGDGLDLAWSIPNEAIIVSKQTIGGTGTFSFSGTNGAPTTSLNTATTNPISSAASNIPNLTLPVTITEAPTSGFTLTGASCVDQSAATIASSLSGSTLTIASSAYSDNGTITCSFINRAVPILSVTKSAPTPALAFGTNSTYTLTTTNAGAGIATTAQVKDQLPAGVSFISASGTNWTCVNASGLITCNFAGGTIAAGGGTSAVSVVVTPLATAGSTNVTNYASVDPSGGSAAPVPGVGCTPVASCASVISPVAAYINPISETGNAVSGIGSTAIANVAVNDTINGAPATLGASGNATLAQSGVWAAGLTLNSATGAVTVAASVQPGSYSVTYQLCDKVTPVSCRTVLDTIIVAASIAPVIDNGSAVSGVASSPVANVAANDVINGAPATLGPSGNAVVQQTGTWPAGISLNPATGAISTTAALMPGNYTVAYQICDKNLPVNCATSNVTITVAANIAPMPDTGSAAAGTLATPIANVASNDSVNGAAAVLSGPSVNATLGVVGSWPAGISLNPTSGAISTTASTPPGTYALPYRLCDTNVPVNCANATATFTLSASILPLPDVGSGVSGVASTVIMNIVSNDRVNGSAATLAGASFNATVSQSGSWPTGITLNPLTGNVAIAPSVQPGIYVLTYQLCDRNTPVNCATNTNTITVAAAIGPVSDGGSATSGTPATPIPNVANNDTLNGSPATLGPSGNATVATVGSWPVGVALNPLTGAVTTAGNVQPGTYALTYQLCDKNTPVNCQNQIATITVAAQITPVNDVGSAPSGTASTPISNVAANDSVNGFSATLGPSGNAVVAQSGTWPLGITLNPATGAISTTDDVQPGTYGVAYQLCDKNVPVNCRVANATVTVVGTIVPMTDSGTAISGTPATPIANIASNDMVNGDPATLGPSGNATLSQSGTWPVGITLNPLTGAISTSAGVQPGNYTLTYQLCDKSVPVYCALTTLTVAVAADIAPASDTGMSSSGTAATAISNVLANDSVNGAPTTLGASGNATLTQVSSTNPGVTLNPATGAVTVSPSVQPGPYVITYRLCDRNSPANCATTTASITVNANIAPTSESGAAISGTPSTPISNIAANDLVNGFSATLGAGANATVSTSGTWPTGIALNPTTGAITTTSGVAPGTYVISYQLCDRNTPLNCAIINDTLTVSGDIRPRLDTGSAIAGTNAVAIPNVAANDQVNGAAATLGSSGNATIATVGVWPAGLTLDPATGAISSDTTAIPGTYTLPYRLCDTSAPANCADQNAIVTVFAAIRPSPDIVTVSAAGGTALPNVTANDVVNGTPVTLGSGGNATVGQVGIWPAGITLDPTTGAVTVLAGTPPGTYTVDYQLCDLNLPVNCATTLVTIRISAEIVPVHEGGSAVSGTPSVAIADVLANDTVNGIPATLGVSGNATVATSGIWPAGFSLNPATGAISTQSNVQPGVYALDYRLCDINTPVNCATTTDTITVTANIAPSDDSATMVAGTPTEAIANVAANDNVNGFPATLGPSGNATIAPSGSWPTGIALNAATGTVSVGPRVQPGTYVLDYELCDRNTPPNCMVAHVTINVSATILPALDSGTAIAGTASTPILDIAANDSVNGTPAIVAGSSATARVAVSGLWPAGFDLVPTTGSVSISNGVAPGTYLLPYELCDRNAPPNCANSTATIVVRAEILPTSRSGSALSGVPTIAITTIAVGDRVNGNPAIIGGATPNATIATSGSWPTGITLDPSTGNVSTDASVQPGTYVVAYQLCDVNTPTNCATQNLTVSVGAVISPVADTGSATSGTASTPISNLVANDVINGAPATVGVGGNATVAPSGTWPAGITLDPLTGAVSTNANVQPGTYTVQYTVCDTNTPANCSTQSAQISVASNIAPRTDTGTATAGTPSTPIANVTINDAVNGMPATLGPSGNATIAQSGSWPVGITLDTQTGAISTSAAVQPGTYNLYYQLCDRSTPANCALQSMTVSVSGSILPVADNGTAVSGTPSTPITNVAVNDVVNGTPATLGVGGNATIAPSGTWPVGITLDPQTGAVSTSSGVQPGTYNVTYQLCDRSAPANCATQNATVTVASAILPVSDSGTATSGTPSTPIGNVVANDVVNGTSATLGPNGNATVAPSGARPAGITLDPQTGSVSTSAGVQPGTYALQYDLCDRNTPANCAVQTLTVTVSSNIQPASDSGTATSGTPSTPVISVVANDVVNGTSVALGTGGNATIAPVGTWPVGIVLDPQTGAVSTSATVQPGTYVVAYQLCDTNTPANCATQTVTITVSSAIVPASDSGLATAGIPSIPILNIVANDRVNGTPATLGTNGNASIAPNGNWPTGITLDPQTGAVSTSAALAPGVYNLRYQVCDRNTPANCATQTIAVTIASSILPTPDTGTATSRTPSTPITNVAVNDVVNGMPATLGPNGNASVAPVGTWPAGITLDPLTGAVSTSADVPAGTYALTYQLCDTGTPANCATQTVSITIVESRGAITGSVYSDLNVDGQRQGNEPPRSNWVVQLVANGVVIATTTTDGTGMYRFDNVAQSPNYEIRFISPENNVVYGMRRNVAVTAGVTVVDQNQPIDPAGVIFDAVTRLPVSGAIVTMTDATGTPLPPTCFLDASQRSQRTGPSGEYRFDIVPGGAAQCPVGETTYRLLVTPPAGYSADSSILLPLTGPFDPTGLLAPVRISPTHTPAMTGEIPYYLSFRLAAGDPDVVFNHIPLDPFLTRAPLMVTKTSTKRSASIGDLVPYEITVRNTENTRRAGLTIADILPSGMRFVAGSATADGIATTPIVTDREVTWSNQTIPANASVQYRLVLVVGAGVTGGDKVNTGLARKTSDGSVISNRGTAAVTIVPSAVFDCSDLIGKVFEDTNRNGYQDEGEAGIAGVRLVTVNGQLITTDANGRYHVTCAGVPDARIGSNLVLKVDTRSLPLDWLLTTDNPRSIRLTRGKFGELNFGVAPPPTPPLQAPPPPASQNQTSRGQ